ncbi:MAG: 2-oxoglutarate ferredoxin oxidoreductase subunit beta [Myxococcota bacterium]|jgi:2-oxoglutarate ferredoxin oxidoreductase subunit beta
MSNNEEVPSYSKKDFMSDQTIRWCPGCGDYSILSQVQTVFAGLGIPREKFAVISGIGCSSRFPYYMDTYGFHTIHGRAPAFATGLKVTNPELSVWVITGDGDALSIGGNHLIHVLRRNVDLQLLLFNNRIYGLTKGQYSPTSEVGKRTKSTPMGSIDHPFEPCAVALGADASFVARTVDVFVREQRAVLNAAHEHKGTSFVEIYQNCNIFNDYAFSNITDKKVRHTAALFAEHGKPLTYGGKGDPVMGLRLDPVRLRLEVVEVGKDCEEADLLVHDETNPVLAGLLVRLRPPMPVVFGVILRVQRPCYEAEVHAQLDEAQSVPGAGDLSKLLYSGDTWVVE